MDLRRILALGLVMLLPGCVSERHAARDAWPFGNPNAPLVASETGERALGHDMVVTPIPPQAGDVWPGPVQPVPTLNDIEKNANLPLGQGYTPSLPSPYPPGQTPVDNSDQQPPAGPVTGLPKPGVIPDGSVYATQPDGGAAGVVPPVPGDAR